MQRTVLEGAIAGATIGGLGGYAIGGVQDGRKGLQIGLLSGVPAGTYVAFLQRRYFREERRLERVQDDLDANIREIEATVAVMRDVLEAQKVELANIRAAAATGQGDEVAVRTELAEAGENLNQMQLAIEGAENRQAEFEQTRSLELIDRSGEVLDSDFDLLAGQIGAMRQIAEDLAQEL